MPLPKNFQSFAEFERDYLRGGSRLNASVDDLVEDDVFDAEIIVDDDPFEAMRGDA